MPGSVFQAATAGAGRARRSAASVGLVWCQVTERTPTFQLPRVSVTGLFFTFSHPQGEYTVSSRGTQTMLNSLMYKMSYYDFGNIMTENGKGTGYDRVRQYEIGNKDTELNHLYEVSRGWLGVVGAQRAC